MKTVIHYYCYNLYHKVEAEEYSKLLEQLNKTHKHLLVKAYSISRLIPKNESKQIDLETDCLFQNQWNSEEGRVFDWVEYTYENKYIKAGHCLEQTQEMIDIRDNTYKCGYCGEISSNVGGFCKKCLGSKYLSQNELQLLRLKPISDKRTYPALNQIEVDYLLPLYYKAQGLGEANRESELRYEVDNLVTEAIKVAENMIKEAEIKRQAFSWLLDHYYKHLDNVIYYSHTKKFCFGWRGSVKNKEQLKKLLTDFPFDYEIK